MRDSPEGAVLKYYSCCQSNDFDSAWRHVARASRLDLTSDQFVAYQEGLVAPRSAALISQVEINGSEVRGDQGTVHVKIERISLRGVSYEELSLGVVKEEATWKILLPDDLIQAALPNEPGG